MTAVDEEIDQRLKDVYQIRTRALFCDDQNLKLELLANLLYLYDNSWSLEQEGTWIIIGHTNQHHPEDLKKPAVVKKIRKWLTLSELGHLLVEGPNLVDPRKFGRLVTGLMDRLEQKLGREGLRSRVRTVASQANKARGKENVRSQSPTPLQQCSTDSLISVPPPPGQEIPRTPCVDVIPRGKQLPRTPPGSREESMRSVSSASSEELTSDLQRLRRPQRPRQKITLEDFDSPAEASSETGGRFISRDMLARTPVCPVNIVQSSPSPPSAPSTPSEPPCQDLSLPPPPSPLQPPPLVSGGRPSGVYQVPQYLREEEERRQREEEARRERDEEERKQIAEKQRKVEEVRRRKREELEMKKKNAEIEKLTKENLELKDKNKQLAKELLSSKSSEKTADEKYLKLEDKLKEKEQLLENSKLTTANLEKELKAKEREVRDIQNSNKIQEANIVKLTNTLKEKDQLIENYEIKIEEQKKQLEVKSQETRSEEDIQTKKVEEDIPGNDTTDKVAEASSIPSEVKPTDEEPDVLQESSISSSRSEDLSMGIQELRSSNKDQDSKEELNELSTKNVEIIESKEGKRKQLLKEAMRANVEKRRQRNIDIIKKTNQITESAKARREKFEEDQRKKRESLQPVATPEKSIRIGRRQTTKTQPIEEVDHPVSPTKKMKLADKVQVTAATSQKTTDKTVSLKSCTLADTESDLDESPPFYPLPIASARKGKVDPNQEKIKKSPITSKRQQVKSRKRRNPPEDLEVEEKETAEVQVSPPKKGKKYQKKMISDKKEPKKTEEEAKAANILEEEEEEEEEEKKEISEVDKKEKPRRGRKPKAKPVVEEIIEDVKVVKNEEITAETKDLDRPRRNAKKKYDSLADLASNSIPNSPAVPPTKQVEAKKRGRQTKKIVVNSLEVPPPSEPDQEPLSKAKPDQETDTEPKKAPTKRGRKPGPSAPEVKEPSTNPGPSASTPKPAQKSTAVLPKRGRKPGKKAAAEVESSPAVLEKSNNPPPRSAAKRGRPKKEKN